MHHKFTFVNLSYPESVISRVVSDGKRWYYVPQNLSFANLMTKFYPFHVVKHLVLPCSKYAVLKIVV